MLRLELFVGELLSGGVRSSLIFTLLLCFRPLGFQAVLLDDFIFEFALPHFSVVAQAHLPIQQPVERYRHSLGVYCLATVSSRVGSLNGLISCMQLH